MHQARPFCLEYRRSRSSREGLFGSLRLDEAEQLDLRRTQQELLAHARVAALAPLMARPR
jgi:hypothetical protein